MVYYNDTAAASSPREFEQLCLYIYMYMYIYIYGRMYNVHIVHIIKDYTCHKGQPEAFPLREPGKDFTKRKIFHLQSVAKLWRTIIFDMISIFAKSLISILWQFSFIMSISPSFTINLMIDHNCHKTPPELVAAQVSSGANVRAKPIAFLLTNWRGWFCAFSHVCHCTMFCFYSSFALGQKG